MQLHANEFPVGRKWHSCYMPEHTVQHLAQHHLLAVRCTMKSPKNALSCIRFLHVKTFAPAGGGGGGGGGAAGAGLGWAQQDYDVA